MNHLVQVHLYSLVFLVSLVHLLGQLNLVGLRFHLILVHLLVLVVHPHLWYPLGLLVPENLQDQVGLLLLFLLYFLVFLVTHLDLCHL